MGSSDGIDPDHCQNVRIVNCHIESADDCIVLKNTEGAMEYGNCENIVIANCTLMSTSAAIKIGTESEALFRNILVQNCNISRTNRGISLQLRDKGSIENAVFSNINIVTERFSPEHWWGSAEPIAITALPRKEETKLGCIKNITFQNINCDSENGILIYGADPDNISRITFEHVYMCIKKKTDWQEEYYDLRPTCREAKIKGSVHGVFVHNTKQVMIHDLQVEVDEYIKQVFGEVVFRGSVVFIRRN